MIQKSVRAESCFFDSGGMSQHGEYYFHLFGEFRR
jgi:hypothetical protein